MVELKSIDFTAPPRSALESVEAVRAEPMRQTQGNRGAAETARSRAATLLGVGKQEAPLRAAGGALETVIGFDDRQRILETELFPWRMICALKITAALGIFIGTGWLAGPRTLVTAGHCVYHLQEMDGWATEIEVAPGRDEAETPYGAVTSRRFSAVNRWIETQEEDFDIGCIHLDQPLGEQTGWFATATLPVKDLRQRLINISGYPGDKPRRFDPRAGTQQFFHKNRVLQVTDRRLFYDVDTSGGQSGSPVWIQDAVGGEPKVVGIHAYGTGGTPRNFNITANSSPRILPEVLTMIEGWVAQSSAVS